MFNYIFSMFISIAIMPVTVAVRSANEIRDSIVHYVEEIPSGSGFFVPRDFDSKYNNLTPFISRYFNDNKARKNNDDAIKIKIYIFNAGEVAQNKKTSEIFGITHRFALAESNRLNLPIEVNNMPNMGLRLCFSNPSGSSLNLNSRRAFFSKTEAFSFQSLISDGKLDTNLAADCIVNYWGAFSKTSAAEVFLGSTPYKLKSNDQFIALYQEKTGRLLLMMSSSTSHETLEVFTIDNFDKYSRNFFNYIRSSLDS